MKIINCNNWSPRNKSNIVIPITDPSVDLLRLLIKLYFTYSLGRFVYYRLENLVTYSFLNREDDYFNESD
ncbi:hypothetical protein AVV41_gp141 [Microcystis phage MaMV-DC]|uniref:Uncharacterized protein n=1 Tax=Microcystis phage MaMV-DC TaxID=1357715 RepID=A0A075BS36_9CAUD|nr:hypothetical protein AVV41_gp141 [Microcystis phage MaMV-DC]AGR48706.1 hypothetical protein MaMVDC_141 [Microcystis phage MaMV-DC]